MTIMILLILLLLLIRNFQCFTLDDHKSSSFYDNSVEKYISSGLDDTQENYYANDSKVKKKKKKKKTKSLWRTVQISNLRMDDSNLVPQYYGDYSDINIKEQIVKSECESSPCPQGWSEIKNSCVIPEVTYCSTGRKEKHKQGCNWFQAKKVCSKINGYLAEINSKKEHDEIMEIILKKKIRKNFYWWIGLRDHYHMGNFQWNSDSKNMDPVKFLPWCHNRPVPKPNLSCIRVDRGNPRRALQNKGNLPCWENVRCHTLGLPLCERPKCLINNKTTTNPIIEITTPETNTPFGESITSTTTITSTLDADEVSSSHKTFLPHLEPLRTTTTPINSHELISEKEVIKSDDETSHQQKDNKTSSSAPQTTTTHSIITFAEKYFTTNPTTTLQTTTQSK